MTEPNRQSGEKEERIIEIEIERLRPFKEHPFQVKDDKEMFLLQESIEKYGILNPLIVRPVPDGYYEIISGHRRKHAAEKLGYRKVPVIIRVLSEDDSILSMVDSNLHRERISYSEKAFAYKLKNDVLKRKSGRKKSQVDHKTLRKRSIDIISEDCGDSPKQVQRYISLTKLIPEMLQKLDDGDVAENWKTMLTEIQLKLIKEDQKFSKKLGQWDYFGEPIGDFNTEYAYRALVALAGLGANTVEVALYPKIEQDADGNTLLNFL